MASQFNFLRNQAVSLLNPSVASEHKKEPLELIVDELLTYQVELEIQNTHYLETQNLLVESNNKYLTLFNFAPLGYFLLNEKGIILEVNDKGSQILGITKKSLINRTLTRYISPESQMIFSEFRKNFFKNISQPPCEIKLLKKNGPLTCVRIEGRVAECSLKKTSYLLLMIIDISHLQYSNNKQLSFHTPTKTQELALSFAEEINHPLAVIGNYIHGSIRRLENSSSNKEIISGLEKAAVQLQRASEIILRMKNFQYVEHANKQPTCLHTLIKETIELIHQEMDTFSMQLSYIQNKNISTVVLDKFHIQQVLLHLARNSVEAMQDAEISDPKLKIEVIQLSKRMFQIAVEDNGPGYPDEHAHRVFEPGFTTKSYGTGLGLAICRTIVELHGGKLITELNLFNGVCFKFSLPLIKE
ncbi:MAG: PAS domain S-box protein [Gammaproteobacteria bacterium]|nr:PAS domain S-box protein [Gammaproteobacteria bacterium]